MNEPKLHLHNLKIQVYHNGVFDDGKMLTSFGPQQKGQLPSGSWSSANSKAPSRVCPLIKMLTRQRFVLSCLPKPPAPARVDLQTAQRTWTVRLVHFAESAGDKLARFAVANVIANSLPPSTVRRQGSERGQELLAALLQPYKRLTWQKLIQLFDGRLEADNRPSPLYATQMTVQDELCRSNFRLKSVRCVPSFNEAWASCMLTVQTCGISAIIRTGFLCFFQVFLFFKKKQ